MSALKAVTPPHDFYKPHPRSTLRCRHCRKAYWRGNEPCSLDVIQEPNEPEDPRDPRVRSRRIAAYLEAEGLADEVMTVGEAKILLKVIGTEYDEDPLRFLPYATKEEE